MYRKMYTLYNKCIGECIVFRINVSVNTLYNKCIGECIAFIINV